MRVNPKLILTFLVSLLWGCEEATQVDTGPGTERLVVEGLITDQPGPYTVTLTTTAAYFLMELW